tara:strand:+ start:2198 stop:2707 length:510 start_codon:yes stop_codon:yes gene_type:complete
MNELPDDLLVKIMLYSDNTNLHIVNKYINTIIKELKSNYLSQPLTIYYRLVKWTYQTGTPLIINSNNRPEYRPRMKVGKIENTNIRKVKLGEVKNDCNIYPSKILEKSLIMPYYVKPTSTPYIVTKRPMYNIYSMWVKKEDYDKAKIYEMLYPSLEKNKYVMPYTRHTL